MSKHLAPLIAATTQWLVRSYPTCGGAFSAALATMQAHQAVTVAAWLRYPTAIDAALVELVGAGGSARLDQLAGHQPDDHAWRSWVDEVVASWAACLLTERDVALSAVAALDDTEHATGSVYEFRRLTDPDQQDNTVAALLRHPQLVEPVAALHRLDLYGRLRAGSRPAASADSVSAGGGT